MKDDDNNNDDDAEMVAVDHFVKGKIRFCSFQCTCMYVCFSNNGLDGGGGGGG